MVPKPLKSDSSSRHADDNNIDNPKKAENERKKNKKRESERKRKRL